MAQPVNAGVFDQVFKRYDQVHELQNSINFNYLHFSQGFGRIVQGGNNPVLNLVQGSFLVQNSASLSAKTTINNSGVVLQELIVPASAYSSTIDQTDDSPFITAWGTYVRDGIIAANFLPFGTKIKIPDVYGDKVFVVEDRMNARYWQKIDIWFPDRQSAKEFGIKYLKIQILES